jgi:hypothetical protein
MASMLEGENTIEIVKGTTKTVSLSVVDGAGAIVDLTGARVILTVKCKITDTNPTLQKDSAVVVVPPQAAVTEPLAGKAEFYFVPADTANLTDGRYIFDVWVILAGGERYVVAGPGAFIVTSSVLVLLP